MAKKVENKYKSAIPDGNKLLLEDVLHDLDRLVDDLRAAFFSSDPPSDPIAELAGGAMMLYHLGVRLEHVRHGAEAWQDWLQATDDAARLGKAPVQMRLVPQPADSDDDDLDDGLPF